MSQVVYPLGHQDSELARLDAQALLFRDPLLEELASASTKCLEIGCGNGSNFSLLKAANRKLQYVGIDSSRQAIMRCKARYEHQSSARFLEADATSFELPEASFDLVFSKLVLWSIGAKWTEVLQRAFSLLHPGGYFYAFEPSNDRLEMHPEKPNAKAWMDLWHDTAIDAGMDPYIGPKVAGKMKAAGFVDIETRFFPVIASGREKERYAQIMQNLKNFYTGDAARSLGLPNGGQLHDSAMQEFCSAAPGDLVMDALYVTYGRKPQVW